MDRADTPGELRQTIRLNHIASGLDIDAEKPGRI